MRKLILISTTILLMLLTFNTKTSANTKLRPLSNMTYLKSSQSGPYPNLQQCQNLNVLAKIKQNKVFIKDGSKTIYTMYCSAGKIDPTTHRSFTPTGHFKIQVENGDSFYNNNLKEGANNWISFKDHGVYLFHSVPTDQNGNYKSKASVKLGRHPDSHGCIRLSVPDSKWFKNNIPINTPVTIEE